MSNPIHLLHQWTKKGYLMTVPASLVITTAIYQIPWWTKKQLAF